MTPTEAVIYSQVVKVLAKEYPNSKIKFEEGVVSLKKGEEFVSFSTAGYNLLACLSDLVDALKNKIQ